MMEITNLMNNTIVLLTTIVVGGAGGVAGAGPNLQLTGSW